VRILHTSDLHLGKRLHQHSLLADQRNVLEQLTAAVESQRPDLFVVAGDVFDRSLPPEDAVSLFGDWLYELHRRFPDLPVVLIAGNHDSARRLAWPSRLLERGNIFIRGEPRTVNEPIEIKTQAGERAQIWALPFVWPGDFTNQEGARSTMVSAFETGISWVKQGQDQDQIQVLVAHCFTRGSEPSDSERTLVGQATLIDTDCFDGFDYVALGHLHRPQSVTPHVHYSGSPLAYSFSEDSDLKSFIVAECQAGQSPQIERIALTPLRPLRKVQASVEELLQSERYDHLKESYLMVSLTEPSALPDPMSRLRDRFPYLLHLRTVTPEAPEQTVKVAQRSAKPDLEADLRGFWAHINAEPPGEEVMEAFVEIRVALSKAGGQP